LIGALVYRAALSLTARCPLLNALAIFLNGPACALRRSIAIIRFHRLGAVICNLFTNKLVDALRGLAVPGKIGSSRQAIRLWLGTEIGTW
jgi:hypothetical protein